MGVSSPGECRSGGGLFLTAPRVNGSAGTCHSEGPAWDDQR